MPPTIVPSTLPFVGAGAAAEKKAVEFLKALPENYYVLRELRTDASLDKKRSGASEDRPDLIVIGPELGVVILEVKDWNIRDNKYEWRDQYSLTKTNAKGEVSEIGNPYAQVDEYNNALKQLLQSFGKGALWVSGLVVFPKVERSLFENTFSFDAGSANNARWGNNPQQRFIYDQNLTIFSEELSQFFADPLKLLLAKLKKLASIRNTTLRQYEQSQVEQTVNHLVPAKARVGDKSGQAKALEELKLMDQNQQKWAFNLPETGQNYLLDVAGSGKTNILISRAMHLVDLHGNRAGFKVLLLTYNEALAKDIARIFRSKIDRSSHEPDPFTFIRYDNSIAIRHMQALMEEIVKFSFSSNVSEFDKWRSPIIGQVGEADYCDYKLPEKCMDVMDEKPEAFRRYDHILIDEVQDFSTEFLYIAKQLLKPTGNLFMVGDAGQKLFDRYHSLSELDIIEERVSLQRGYQMYRNPMPVARLAWDFLRTDPAINQELKEQGYESTIKFKNKLNLKPVFRDLPTQVQLTRQVADDVEQLLNSEARPEQVLCVGLGDSLQNLRQFLDARNIDCCVARDINHEKNVVLAEYVEAKGLEREHIFILDIDRLPDGSSWGSSSNVFENLDKESSRSRTKIFVALTRTIQTVTAYYTNPNNRFVKELLQLNSKQ